MSKGNANKRKGTSNERKLLLKLWDLDPDGRWESRTTLPDGEKRPEAPSHGWDIHSFKRQMCVEAKTRKGDFTPKLFHEWLNQGEPIRYDGEPFDSCVIYRKHGASQYWVAQYVGDKELLPGVKMLGLYPLEDYISFLQAAESD